MLLFFVFSFTLYALPAAAGGLVPCGGEGEPQCEFKHLVALIVRLINYLITMAALVAIHRVLTIGFDLATSLGNPEKIKKQRQGLTQAVVGFAIIVLAFTFVNLLVNGLFGKPGAERKWWNPECIYDITEIEKKCPL